AKEKMFKARSKRVRPHLDDKILASWNGMMLGAIARAYAVLGEDSYLSAVEKNVAFIRAKLWDAQTKTLSGRWRDAERDNVQLLGKICERKDFTEAAEKTLRLFAERLQMQPQAVPQLLICLDFSLEEPKRVVIAGPERKPLLLAAHHVYQPNKVVLGVEGPVE